MQLRIISAIVLLLMVAIATGSVLVLGYAFAAFSLGVVFYILGRKLMRRIGDARLANPRLSRAPRPTVPGGDDESERIAA